MTFHTPPRNQGQTVTYSYAATEGAVVMCRYDACDRSVTYKISKMLKDDECDYWNREPSNKRWRKMTEKEIRTHGLEVH